MESCSESPEVANLRYRYAIPDAVCFSHDRDGIYYFSLYDGIIAVYPDGHATETCMDFVGNTHAFVTCPWKTE